MLSIKCLTDSIRSTSKDYGECYFCKVKKLSVFEDVQSSLKCGWHSRKLVAVGLVYIDKMLTFGLLRQTRVSGCGNRLRTRGLESRRQSFVNAFLDLDLQQGSESQERSHPQEVWEVIMLSIPKRLEKLKI